MIHVDEVNDIHELDGYRLLWNALLPQTRGATFFQSFGWLRTYWEHFGADQKLRVLVVCSHGRPVGILPLVVRREKSRVGRLRVLSYPLHDWGTFYGPIGPNPTATLTGGLQHIRKTSRDYDLLDLRWIDRDASDHGRAEAAMRRAEFDPHIRPWDRASVVQIHGTWDEYWCSRDKKWRCNLERCERRMAERGKVTTLRYRPAGAAHDDGNPRWDLYDACVRTARRSWQGSSMTGTTLSHPEVAGYLRETHAAAAQAGSLDLNLLLLNDRPVAFIYNYVYQGRVYGLRKGFDPEVAGVRPGAVLQKRVLEDSFRRGDSIYDMGVGSLDVKRHWQTSIVTSYRCTHFPAALARVQLLRMKRWLQDKFTRQGQSAGPQTAKSCDLSASPRKYPPTQQ